MSNLISAVVQIVGTKPLAQHRFGVDAMPLEKQEKSGVAGNNPEEWRQSCMVTKNGQLFVPPTYIFACIREGSKNTKKGRGNIMKNVVSTLQVTDSIILFDRYFPGFPSDNAFDVKSAEPPSDDVSLPVYLDICGVRNPVTKGRNVRYRLAMSAGWKTSFNICWDKTIVSRGEMEACCIDAGRLQGIGDGRSVGFGRFDVVSFEITER